MAKLYPNGYPYAGLYMLGLTAGDRTSTLAENLKALRISEGLTQAAFALRVQAYSRKRGVKFGGRYGNQLVSAYERQICSPKLDNLIAICEAFNVNPIELCGYDPADIWFIPQKFLAKTKVGIETNTSNVIEIREMKAA